MSPVTCYIAFNLFRILFTHLKTCPWQHLLATFCLSGCFGAVLLTPPKISFSTDGILRSLRNLDVNCANFFGTCCCPADWARPNPNRKTKDEDSVRSEFYIHLGRSLQSFISCWQDATLDDVTSTLGRDQLLFTVHFSENTRHHKRLVRLRYFWSFRFSWIFTCPNQSTINMSEHWYGNLQIVKSRVKNCSTANHMRGSSQCCLIWTSELSVEFLVYVMHFESVGVGTASTSGH